MTFEQLMRDKGFENSEAVATESGLRLSTIQALFTGDWSLPPKFMVWQYHIPSIAKATGASVGEIINAARETKWAGWVYLVRDASEYKVGRTRLPEQRFLALKSRHPSLVFVHKISTNDSLRLEQNLHRLYAPYKIHGEWFSLPNQEILNFRSIRTYKFKASIYDGCGET